MKFYPEYQDTFLPLIKDLLPKQIPSYDKPKAKCDAKMVEHIKELCYKNDKSERKRYHKINKNNFYDINQR